MNRILEEQQRRNQLCRDTWDRFAPHRERVTSLLCSAAVEPAGRLCVLGAGNCNDLDLGRLAAAFREVQLVDWDTTALVEGIEQQTLAVDVRQKIKMTGDVDLTSIGHALSNWTAANPPTSADVQQLIAQATAANPLPTFKPFEVMASVGTLSQLIESVLLSLSEQHPQMLDLVVAVRARHLRLLAELTAPGGQLVLVTDVVSSRTYPPLPQVPEAQLPATLMWLIQNHNFFTGLNPLVLENLFRNDPQLAPLVTNVRLWPPWLWDFGPRVYAVCAITARRV